MTASFEPNKLLELIAQDAKIAAEIEEDPDDCFIQAEGALAAFSLPSGIQAKSNLKSINKLNIEECYNLLTQVPHHFQKLFEELKELCDDVKEDLDILTKASHKLNHIRKFKVAKLILHRSKHYDELDLSISWSVFDSYNSALRRFKKLYLREKKTNTHEPFKVKRNVVLNQDNAWYDIHSKLYTDLSKKELKPLLNGLDALFENCTGYSVNDYFEGTIGGFISSEADHNVIFDDGYSDDAGPNNCHLARRNQVSDKDDDSFDIECDFEDEAQLSDTSINSNRNPRESRIIDQEYAAGSKRIRSTIKKIDKYEAGKLNAPSKRSSSKVFASKKARTDYNSFNVYEAAIGNIGNEVQDYPQDLRNFIWKRRREADHKLATALSNDKSSPSYNNNGGSTFNDSSILNNLTVRAETSRKYTRDGCIIDNDDIRSGNDDWSDSDSDSDLYQQASTFPLSNSIDSQISYQNFTDPLLHFLSQLGTNKLKCPVFPSSYRLRRISMSQDGIGIALAAQSTNFEYKTARPPFRDEKEVLDNLKTKFSLLMSSWSSLLDASISDYAINRFKAITNEIFSTNSPQIYHSFQLCPSLFVSYNMESCHYFERHMLNTFQAGSLSEIICLYLQNQSGLNSNDSQRIPLLPIRSDRSSFRKYIPTVSIHIVSLLFEWYSKKVLWFSSIAILSKELRCSTKAYITKRKNEGDETKNSTNPFLMYELTLRECDICVCVSHAILEQVWTLLLDSAVKIQILLPICLQCLSTTVNTPLATSLLKSQFPTISRIVFEGLSTHIALWFIQLWLLTSYSSRCMDGCISVSSGQDTILSVGLVTSDFSKKTLDYVFSITASGKATIYTNEFRDNGYIKRFTNAVKDLKKYDNLYSNYEGLASEASLYHVNNFSSRLVDLELPVVKCLYLYIFAFRTFAYYVSNRWLKPNNNLQEEQYLVVDTSVKCSNWSQLKFYLETIESEVTVEGLTAENFSSDNSSPIQNVIYTMQAMSLFTLVWDSSIEAVSIFVDISEKIVIKMNDSHYIFREKNRKCSDESTALFSMQRQDELKSIEFLTLISSRISSMKANNMPNALKSAFTNDINFALTYLFHVLRVPILFPHYPKLVKNSIINNSDYFIPELFLNFTAKVSDIFENLLKSWLFRDNEVFTLSRRPQKLKSLFCLNESSDVHIKNVFVRSPSLLSGIYVGNICRHIVRYFDMKTLDSGSHDTNISDRANVSEANVLLKFFNTKLDDVNVLSKISLREQSTLLLFISGFTLNESCIIVSEDIQSSIQYLTSNMTKLLICWSPLLDHIQGSVFSRFAECTVTKASPDYVTIQLQFSSSLFICCSFFHRLDNEMQNLIKGMYNVISNPSQMAAGEYILPDITIVINQIFKDFILFRNRLLDLLITGVMFLTDESKFAETSDLSFKCLGIQVLSFTTQQLNSSIGFISENYSMLTAVIKQDSHELYRRSNGKLSDFIMRGSATTKTYKKDLDDYLFNSNIQACLTSMLKSEYKGTFGMKSLLTHYIPSKSVMAWMHSITDMEKLTWPNISSQRSTWDSEITLLKSLQTCHKPNCIMLLVETLGCIVSASIKRSTLDRSIPCVTAINDEQYFELNFDIFKLSSYDENVKRWLIMIDTSTGIVGGAKTSTLLPFLLHSKLWLPILDLCTPLLNQYSDTQDQKQSLGSAHMAIQLILPNLSKLLNIWIVLALHTVILTDFEQIFNFKRYHQLVEKVCGVVVEKCETLQIAELISGAFQLNQMRPTQQTNQSGAVRDIKTIVKLSASFVGAIRTVGGSLPTDVCSPHWIKGVLSAFVSTISFDTKYSLGNILNGSQLQDIRVAHAKDLSRIQIVKLVCQSHSIPHSIVETIFDILSKAVVTMKLCRTEWTESPGKVRTLLLHENNLLFIVFSSLSSPFNALPIDAERSQFKSFFYSFISVQLERLEKLVSNKSDMTSDNNDIFELTKMINLLPAVIQGCCRASNFEPSGACVENAIFGRILSTCCLIWNAYIQEKQQNGITHRNQYSNIAWRVLAAIASSLTSPYSIVGLRETVLHIMENFRKKSELINYDESKTLSNALNEIYTAIISQHKNVFHRASRVPIMVNGPAGNKTYIDDVNTHLESDQYGFSIVAIQRLLHVNNNLRNLREFVIFNEIVWHQFIGPQSNNKLTTKVNLMTMIAYLTQLSHSSSYNSSHTQCDLTSSLNSETLLRCHIDAFHTLSTIEVTYILSTLLNSSFQLLRVLFGSNPRLVDTSVAISSVTNKFDQVQFLRSHLEYALFILSTSQLNRAGYFHSPSTSLDSSKHFHHLVLICIGNICKITNGKQPTKVDVEPIRYSSQEILDLRNETLRAGEQAYQLLHFCQSPLSNVIEHLRKHLDDAKKPFSSNFNENNTKLFNSYDERQKRIDDFKKTFPNHKELNIRSLARKIYFSLLFDCDSLNLISTNNVATTGFTENTV